ncbi:MAG: hypothetical protein GTO14_11360 [Anaerolineales bacterium]|nr:hypothetical protein [Anaerolineales bacterium]
MNTRMSFEAMQAPTEDHDESDMGAWANRWHFTGDETGNGAQDSETQVETSEKPTTFGGARDSDSNDH